MEATPSTYPVLLTKLHRPPITADLLPRSRLLKRLDQVRRHPLTMISAPAGYGKSVLASMWLHECDWPTAWVSLDKHDNSLVGFLTYFLAAVRSIVPGVILETQAMLRAPKTAPPLVLARSLANDLEQLETPFILVLDDYHHINQMAVHELLDELLLHPPRPLHLVITSRGDAPLNLNRQRTQRQMVEIRLQDLSFTAAETSAFLNEVMGISIDQAGVSRLRDETEGWVTALRLAALSLRHSENLDGLLNGFQADNRYMQDYLAAEVVSSQTPLVQTWLLKVSVSDRICAPLCEVLCHVESDSTQAGLSGRDFLKWLQDVALFVIPLDSQNEWFRFHPLFQNALQMQLEQKMGTEEVSALHARASAWFAANNLLDEALQHALAAGDPISAAEIVEQCWHDEAEAARWYVVERWLAELPTAIKEQRPALLLAEAFGALARLQMEHVPPLIEQAERVLDEQPLEPHLLGELRFLQGTLLYWQGEAELSVRYLEEASLKTADEFTHVKSNIELMLGLALHTNGQAEVAVRTLNDRLQAIDASEVFRQGHLISGLAFIHFLCGKLVQARFQARRMQSVNSLIANPVTEAWGWYLQACTNLNACDLDQAYQQFAIAAQHHYTLDMPAVIDAMAGLALTLQLMGQEEAAAQAIDQLQEFARELNVPQYQTVYHSCHARISLLADDLETAVEWAHSFVPAPGPASIFMWLEVPAITQARVLIALCSEESLEQACESLHMIRQTSETAHFTCQTIEVTVLQSLAYELQGHADQALTTLAEAVILAGPGGWLRPFVELGQPMANLLARLKQQDAASRSETDRILAAFPEEAVKAALELAPASSDYFSPRPTLLGPLTKREFETLQLLATDNSTQEIAAEMVVTVGTVRTYSKRIYSKLDVRSRFEAVVTAKEIGLL